MFSINYQVKNLKIIKQKVKNLSLKSIPLFLILDFWPHEQVLNPSNKNI